MSRFGSIKQVLCALLLAGVSLGQTKVDLPTQTKGILPPSAMPALTGDCVSLAGTTQTTCVGHLDTTRVSKSGDTMTGPLNTPMINGKAYAAGGTLQQAIDAAGATGSVEIPASYAGADTFTNPNNIPVLDQRVMEWRSVTEWGVKCNGYATDNYQKLHDAFIASVNPYKPFGLKFPAGQCYTSKPLPYTCQTLKGVGVGISILSGGPGQDVITNMDPNDRTTDGIGGGSGNGICYWQGMPTKGSISDLTLKLDNNVDITQLNTTLTNAVDTADTTLTLGSTQYYRFAGFVLVDQELIHYTVLSGNTITTSSTVDRGYGGTTAAAHSAGAPIHYLGDLAFSGQGTPWANKPWVSSISYTPAVAFRTHLTATMQTSDTTMTLANVTGMATSGTLQVGGELLTYTGISGTTLTGVIHGAHNTIPAVQPSQPEDTTPVAYAGSTVLYSSYLPGILKATAPIGSSSLTLAYAPIGFPASGMLLIDSERIAYSLISGATITTGATTVPHAPNTVVNVLGGLTNSQSTIAITDNPVGTPIGYADFGGFGEVIGAMGIDYGTGSKEYVTYTGGEPYVIPGSVPTQYFLVYHGVNRGQTSTAAVAHLNTAVINAVNPFTFVTPTQNGTSNGSIPAWNIGNCGLAFHFSDGAPTGTVTVNPTVGNPDLTNFEILGTHNSSGDNSCGILYQSWPYAVAVKNYHIRDVNYGIMWALSGVNNAPQAYNVDAGWPNTSPFNKFQNGQIESPMPWFNIAGPQEVSQLNIESGYAGTRTPYSESRIPSNTEVYDERGYLTGSSVNLEGVTGEFVFNSWMINPFYPIGALYGNLKANDSTSLGSAYFTQQPLYLAIQDDEIKGNFTGNTILTPGSWGNKISGNGYTDLGNDNLFSGFPYIGQRNYNAAAQIEVAGQSRPDALLMGNNNNDWFNSLADLEIQPEDFIITLGGGISGSTYIDPTVPLGRNKAFHITAPGVCCGNAGTLAASGRTLGSRINYGQGIMYVALKADTGPTTQRWLTGVSQSDQGGTFCNIDTSWSVCAVPYDTTTRESISGLVYADIRGFATANGSGVSLGPIVFSPKWDSIYVKTANVDNLVARTVSTPSQVGTAAVAPLYTTMTASSPTYIQTGSTCDYSSSPVVYAQPEFSKAGTATVDNEVISWSSAQCLGDSSVQLNGLTRGLLGTTPAVHAMFAALATIPYSLAINGSLTEICTSTGCNFGASPPTYPLSFGGGYGGGNDGNWHVNQIIPSVPIPYSSLSGLPVIPTIPTLSTVATTGSYVDLLNLPADGIDKVCNTPITSITIVKGKITAIVCP